MSSKKILMACRNYWHSPFQVGSNHLAREFVRRDWEVAFISEPISPLHWLGGASPELRDRLALYRSGGRRDLDGRVWAYAPGTLLPAHNRPLLRSDWVHRNWVRLTWPNAVSQARRSGFGEVDLIYFDSIIQPFWLEAIRHRKSVFRVTDNNTSFETATAASQQLEQELARAVDLVVYPAVQLEPYVRELQPKQMLHLPNGVDFEHFAGADRALPPEYAHIPRPIAVYVGAMNIWFDYELVNRAAAELPDVSFVLIGPDQMARPRLQHLPNLHLLGRKLFDEVPAYLYNADVGIIPFDVKGHADLIHNTNPLKLYEYMACGLPVVSVEWDEMRTLQSPARLCGSPEQFIQGIRAALATPGSPESCREYARGQDWQQRVAGLIAALDL